MCFAYLLDIVKCILFQNLVLADNNIVKHNEANAIAFIYLNEIK